MGSWSRGARRLPRPSWLAPTDTWPRAGHRPGSPVRGYPLGVPRPLVLVGEGPGKDEDIYGYPFVGASGQELDRHLRRVDLDRSLTTALNVTTTVPPKKGALGMANPFLLDQIRAADPLVIVPLGRHATRTFLGDVDLEAVHAIPHAWTAPWGAVYPVVPVYHPAAGMHQVELSAHVAYDFDLLATVVGGEGPALRTGSADEYPNPQYLDCCGRFADFHLIRPEAIAIDTEGSVSRPWCLSVSPEPGLAYVLRKGAGDEAIEGFIDYLTDEYSREDPPLVWLHNSMHDLPVLQALGIDLVEWGVPFLDTMVLAYHLCVEPQGLKPLSLRHCGMVMDSYRDLVGPYTHDRAMGYLLEVATDPVPFPKRPPYVDFEIKDRVQTPKMHTPTPIAKRAMKIVQDVSSGKVNKDGEPTDPYARWYQIEPEDRALAEARYGVLEAATLDDVPLPVAVRYAARDADATRRLGPILRARHAAVFGDALLSRTTGD